MVVHTAMLGNLREPPEPFEDVIRTHFRLKAKEISKQLDKWLEMDDKKAISPEYSSSESTSKAAESGALKTSVTKLKEMLKQLDR